MRHNITLPDVSGLPLFDWAENRDIQKEAYDMWMKGDGGVLADDVQNDVSDIISIDESKSNRPGKEEHFSNSYVKDDESIEVGYNFMYSGMYFRLVAGVYIEHRRHSKQLFDISRVPHLTDVKIFRGYDDVGYQEVQDVSFLDIDSIRSKASIFFHREYLWNNDNSKVA